MKKKLDFFQELANIGSSHGTTALSQMLKDEALKLTVPKAHLFSFDEAAAKIGGSEDVVVCVYMRLVGQFKGNMAFILPFKSAVILANHLTSKNSSELNEIGESALLEVGNIVLSSYLTALSLLGDIRIQFSVPVIAVDMSGAVWQSILADAGITDTVTILDTFFTTKNIELSGQLVFLPNEKDFETLYQKISSELLEED